MSQYPLSPLSHVQHDNEQIGSINFDVILTQKEVDNMNYHSQEHRIQNWLVDTLLEQVAFGSLKLHVHKRPWRQI